MTDDPIQIDIDATEALNAFLDTVTPHLRVRGEVRVGPWPLSIREIVLTRVIDGEKFSISRASDEMIIGHMGEKWYYTHILREFWTAVFVKATTT